mmetsp:Transcript_23903/g.57648  ORF Transcript_23903/g.57648 Transcript_23903/m.57648 type:complete len:235 (+) Transcript_23903:30-734(+)
MVLASTKCVPNGRFFELGRDNRWQQLDRDSPSAITVIQNALKYDPLDGDDIESSPGRLCHFGLLCKSASEEYPVETHEYVESPNPYDVVCEANGLRISPDRRHTGNNRLNVMLNLRMRRYKASTRKGKKNIAKEVVSSIIDDASGHFLQADKPSGKYKIVPRTSAISRITNALDTADVSESEVKKLVRRRRNRAILNRLENHKGGKDLSLFSSSAPPTRFNTSLMHNQFIPRAA